MNKSESELLEHTDNQSSNMQTLRSYETGIQEYISGTATRVSGSVKDWIDRILAYLPSAHAKIIEIGSAFGRDASYIESFGFAVERTDATESFVTFLQKQGHSAYAFNIITDNFKRHYDLIFANAVFLHFIPLELEKVLQKIYASLSENGILAFSVKKGTGEEWTNDKLGRPRYFCYWNEQAITQLLQEQKFEIICTISEDEKFLQIIAKPNNKFANA